MDNEDRERLVRIETKVDMLVTANTDQETRLRAVEKSSWRLGGASMLIAFLAPGLAKYFT